MEEITSYLASQWATVGPLLTDLALAAGILLIALLVSRTAGKAASLALARADLSATHRTFFGGLVRWFVLLLGVAIALDLLGLNAALTGFVASSGAIAIVLGFAFREIGENFLAGLFLAFSRPFNVGDWIASEEHEGEVREIELRNTHIRTADARDIYIPNAQLFNRSLVNFTRDGLRRVEFNVGIAYEEDLEGARELLTGVVAATPGVLGEPGPGVRVSGLLPSYVELVIRFWIDTFATRERNSLNTTEQQQYLDRVRSDVMSRCREALMNEGIIVSANVSTNVALEKVAPHKPGSAA